MDKLSQISLKLGILLVGIFLLFTGSVDQFPIGTFPSKLDAGLKIPFVVGGIILVVAALIFAIKETFDLPKKHKIESTTESATPIKDIATVAAKIAEELKSDSSWASIAFDNAGIHPGPHTIWNRRTQRYSNEKNFIAKEFTKMLLERIKYHIEKRKKRVFLVIDSGTTLFPFFTLIAEDCQAAKRAKEPWIQGNKLVILTNNFPGVSRFVEAGLVDEKSDYPELAVEFHLLPGTPLPAYSALVGEETTDALDKFREKAYKEDPNLVFISLITGSWIGVQEKDNRIHVPVPLARGNNQLAFKQELIKFADETYVIAPLGKVFFGRSTEQINTVLEKYDENGKPQPKDEPYKAVNFDIANKARTIKLVTTRRRNSYFILHPHGERVLVGMLDPGRYDIERIKRQFASLDITSIPPLFFLFDNVVTDELIQLEIEFPQRSDKLLEEFLVETKKTDQADEPITPPHE